MEQGRRQWKGPKLKQVGVIERRYVRADQPKTAWVPLWEEWGMRYRTLRDGAVEHDPEGGGLQHLCGIGGRWGGARGQLLRLPHELGVWWPFGPAAVGRLGYWVYGSLPSPTGSLLSLALHEREQAFLLFF